MPYTEFDPATHMPVATHHTETARWEAPQHAKYLADPLKYGRAFLGVGLHCKLAAKTTGPVEMSTAADGPRTAYTFTARCTYPACIAEAAECDTQAALPELHFVPWENWAIPCGRVLDALRALLAAPALQFSASRDTEGPGVWAYRAGVLRTVVLHLSAEVRANAGQRTEAGAPSARSTADEVHEAAENLGSNGLDPIGDLARESRYEPCVWGEAAWRLWDDFNELAESIERYRPRAIA
ncbi:hypothetical protein ACFYZ9_33905 [Streptomyces sp. NPDC001691]|uniref:hypothetical protein n=1 Tax=Streptomyces sp. NPDC001691 TaxID=3364600 RepID=UPI0036BA7A6E